MATATLASIDIAGTVTTSVVGDGTRGIFVGKLDEGCAEELANTDLLFHAAPRVPLATVPAHTAGVVAVSIAGLACPGGGNLEIG